MLRPPSNTSTSRLALLPSTSAHEDRVPAPYCKNKPLTKSFTYRIGWRGHYCCSSWPQAGGCSWLRGVVCGLSSLWCPVPWPCGSCVGRLFVLCRVR